MSMFISLSTLSFPQQRKVVVNITALELIFGSLPDFKTQTSPSNKRREAEVKGRSFKSIFKVQMNYFIKKSQQCHKILFIILWLILTYRPV